MRTSTSPMFWMTAPFWLSPQGGRVTSLGGGRGGKEHDPEEGGQERLRASWDRGGNHRTSLGVSAAAGDGPVALSERRLTTRPSALTIRPAAKAVPK